MKQAIVGVGSPFGDDQLGWQVIQQLRARLDGRGPDLLALDRPGPTLLHRLQGYDEVVLIDASVSGAVPGTLLEVALADLPTGGTCSTHGFDLGPTLALGEALGMLPRLLRVYAIEIAPADTAAPGSALSSSIGEAVQLLVDRLADRSGSCSRP